MLSSSPPISNKKCYAPSNLYKIVGVNVTPLYGVNSGSVATFYEGSSDAGYAFKQFPDFYVAGGTIPRMPPHKQEKEYQRQIITELKPLY